MPLQVFPYAFTRYAGAPHQDFQALQLHGISRQSQLRQWLAATLQHSRDTLEHTLFEVIRQQEDDQVRKQLIRLKKDITAGKTIAQDYQLPPQAIIPPDFPAQLQRYQQLHSRTRLLQTTWQYYYAQRLLQHRQQLQQLAGNEQLQQGLLLSSPTLYEQLPAFLAADPAGFRHKEQKNEYSLLRYLTRMAFKTSPFSTFTYTGITAVTAACQAITLHTTAPVSSGIRLNNGLFSYLQSLLIQHPVLNEMLYIRLNNTWTIRDGQLHFLVNYFNIESFQRMRAGSITEWLTTFLTQQPATITLGALTDQLLTATADADRNGVKAFLLQLVTAGFLEAGTGCSGINPDWDIALTNFLAQQLTAHPAAAPLHQLLVQLHTARQQFAAADAATRNNLLTAAAEALNSTLHTLHTEAGLPPATTAFHEMLQQNIVEKHRQSGTFEVNTFVPRHFPATGLFYEDTSTSGISQLPLTAVQDFTTKTDRLCEALRPLDFLQPERDRMRDFFRQHYPPGHRENVTDFYHTYYLHEKKQATDPAKEQRASRQAISPALQEILQQRIRIHAVDARHIRLEALTTATSQPGSMAMFVQFFQDTTTPADSISGVINNLLPGLGKVAGRFLDRFDPAVTQLFNEWNRQLHPGYLLMELSDGSSFNANIHPPLLPFESCMPGGYNNYPAGQQLSLQEIQVQYDDTSGQLQLVHRPSQQPVYAFDLCLQAFSMRSNFYRLLAHFNPAFHIPLRQFIGTVDAQHRTAFPATQQEVVVFPRITFETTVVIRRMGWLVNSQVLRPLSASESEADYLLRLHTWRQAAGIPEHIFLFLRTRYTTQTPAQKSELRPDDYKPQYIHFHNPLLVILFRKLLSRAGDQVYLEEMLPHLQYLEQQEQQPPVTEHLLHWYKS
ncbi:lantibiotic dehydratase family protein [Chitinophaga nivalis]|uniref:Lantibiotic dehydratase family protein n=1 Tax=Chitinophaga nivalis TaxID=2991709 RepID=A0ABT3II20_9BACT|nr:lantibiotic dehydratase family protein [Chitinophaga nivalis]MCW3466694.1 lantibiotic dehydratase family protein [Chitinophaga nivalis]MCW3483615.1 lantibiotic dehydratase family protein [Chitinophaga nivalis]